MAKVDQRKYLKKYLESDHSDHRKKKKKSHSESRSARVHIIDDDAEYSKKRNYDDDSDVILTGEDAPQIVGIVDDRPPELKTIEDFRSSGKWKSVASTTGERPRTDDRPRDDLKYDRRSRSPRSDRNEPAKKRPASDDYSPPRRKREHEKSKERQANLYKREESSSESDHSQKRGDERQSRGSRSNSDRHGKSKSTEKEGSSYRTAYSSCRRYTPPPQKSFHDVRNRDNSSATASRFKEDSRSTETSRFNEVRNRDNAPATVSRFKEDSRSSETSRFNEIRNRDNAPATASRFKEDSRSTETSRFNEVRNRDNASATASRFKEDSRSTETSRFGEVRNRDNSSATASRFKEDSRPTETSRFNEVRDRDNSSATASRFKEDSRSTGTSRFNEVWNRDNAPATASRFKEDSRPTGTSRFNENRNRDNAPATASRFKEDLRPTETSRFNEDRNRDTSSATASRFKEDSRPTETSQFNEVRNRDNSSATASRFKADIRSTETRNQPGSSGYKRKSRFEPVKFNPFRANPQSSLPSQYSSPAGDQSTLQSPVKHNPFRSNPSSHSLSPLPERRPPTNDRNSFRSQHNTEAAGNRYDNKSKVGGFNNDSTNSSESRKGFNPFRADIKARELSPLPDIRGSGNEKNKRNDNQPIVRSYAERKFISRNNDSRQENKDRPRQFWNSASNGSNNFRPNSPLKSVIRSFNHQPAAASLQYDSERNQSYNRREDGVGSRQNNPVLSSQRKVASQITDTRYRPASDYGSSKSDNKGDRWDGSEHRRR